MSDNKVDIWMPLYIGDYLGSTSRLTTELHGAYLLLIMDYWKNGPPPDNDSILASITKMTPDAWSIARAVLEDYFDVKGGKWVHRRIDREKEASLHKKSVAKQKAKAAAEARWRKENNATSMPQAMLQAMPEDMLEECPSPSPSPSPKKNKTLTSDYSDDFEEFWKHYPRKVEKAKAYKHWQKIKPDREMFERIINSLLIQIKANDWTRDRVEFIPHPTTWLNGKRWDDEVAPIRKKGGFVC